MKAHAITTNSKTSGPAVGSPLGKFIKRRKYHFWGGDYMVTPRLLDHVEGNGLLVIYFTPLATRPNWYVLRIDSKWGDLDDDDWYDHLDQVYEDLEDQFGQASWQDDNDEWQSEPWPALDDSCGSTWGILAKLKKADRRTEKQIRAAMRKENTQADL